jgi:hypothetical protein
LRSVAPEPLRAYSALRASTPALAMQGGIIAMGRLRVQRQRFAPPTNWTAIARFFAALASGASCWSSTDRSVPRTLRARWLGERIQHGFRLTPSVAPRCHSGVSGPVAALRASLRKLLMLGSPNPLSQSPQHSHTG